MQQERSITQKIRKRRDSGAMLLAVLFMMAVMVVMALAVAPAMIQQAKRDREEEMIHRGTEYARAVKKYYKKYGRYPANLEQLENTNNIRFLRKRFKDPLVKDGQWKLLRYGDIQSLVGGAGFVAPGVSGGPRGQVQGVNPLGGQAAAGNPAGQLLTVAPSQAQQQVSPTNQAAGAMQPGGGSAATSDSGASGAGQSGFSLGPGFGQSGGGTTNQSQNQNQGATGQPGSANTIFGNTGVGGQTFGGGAIVGVASKSKDPTIRIFNKKKTYDEWQFIYTPMLDRQNTLLRGPYNGQTFTGGQFGTQPGQLNQGQGIQSGIGQQPAGYGQQNPQPIQQPNQQLTPGNQFPPDQQQPQQ